MNRPFIGISVFGRGGSAGPNGAPSNLVLTVISPTENQLDWTNGSTNEQGISIERSDDEGNFIEVVLLNPSISTYTDINLSLGILYQYRITVFRNSIYSAYSNVVNNLTGDVSTGLVGRWLLNEGSGNTALDSGGANNGTIVGATYVTGKCGTALSFNGTAGADSVKLGDILDSTTCGANKQFTISAWVKPGVNNMTNNFILCKYIGAPDNQRQYMLSLSTAGKLRFYWHTGLISTASFRATLGTTPITDTTKWYFVEAKYDGTNATINNRVTLFVDCVQEATTISATQEGTPVMGDITDGTAQLCIGAGMNVAGTTSANNWNGLIDSVHFHNRIITYADALSIKYLSYTTPSNIVHPLTAKLYSYNAGSQIDDLLDTTYIGTLTGSFRQVKRPIKYIGNPIFTSGVNNDTWDYEKIWSSVIKIGSTYHLWYSGRTIDVKSFACYATSTDGVTWTKPILGLVSYGGNTNNNIFLGEGCVLMNVEYYPNASADLKYILLAQQKVGDTTGDGCDIYKSADGINFTLIKELHLAAAAYSEGYELIQRPDGKWLAYYSRNHGSDLRAIGVWLSDSDDLTSTWVDQGIVLATTVSTNQKYAIRVKYIDGLYYGLVSNYNSTSKNIFVDLYSSRDGITAWTLRASNWLSLGADTTWEAGMVLSGHILLHGSNIWRNYYTGSPVLHDNASPPFDFRIGIANIGYKRIGGILGAGSLITTAFTPTTGLFINADLTNGTLKVELLLAADNSVIAGYSKDDCNALTGDTYSTEVKWGANSILTDRSLKIKFYLT
jgi:hypothetical protein